MLTFVMPTLNGLNRANLICSWLKHQHFQGHLIVVDGSKKRRSNWAKKWGFVTYIHVPGCSTQSAQFHGFQNVSTPFASIIGDDDFPVLNGCDRCINFLLENKKFGAAHGASSFIDFKKTQDIFDNKTSLDYWYFLKTFFSGRYDMHSDYSSDSCLERIEEFSTNYIVSLFCVARTDMVKKVNNEIINEIQDVHLSEIVSSLGYVISAKIKKIPDLYLLRGLGNHRPNASTSAARHTAPDIQDANKYALKYIDRIGVEKRYRALCLATVISLRLRGFMKTSALGLQKDQTPSKYFIQQFRRLKLSLRPSNLVKLELFIWLRKR
jgi:glycosyltransferase domain-containing protein